MESFHTALTMSDVNDNSAFHKLKNKWNLWAHLPNDPNWTLKSYKIIHQFQTIEETIAITESLPENLIKNCMLFVMKVGRCQE